MKKILVLCTGNSCRSQMAEGYLNFFASDRALFYSAGVIAEGLNPYAVTVMSEDNIDISGSEAKHYRVFRDIHFDYLITVCDEVQNLLPDDIQADRVLHFSVPDPAKAEGGYEKKLAVFREVRELVKKNMLRFIGMELIGLVEKPAVY